MLQWCKKMFFNRGTVNTKLHAKCATQDTPSNHTRPGPNILLNLPIIQIIILHLGQSNYIVSFSSTRFYISMRAGGHYSLFIVQYYGIFRVWFPGTAQIISKKEVWLAFQGNNEGRSGRLKQTRAVTRN